MKLVKTFSSLLIVIASIILCCQIIFYSLSNQKNKNDYAELNSIKYGLLSIEEWNRQVTMILVEKIDTFDLSNDESKATSKTYRSCAEFDYR